MKMIDGCAFAGSGIVISNGWPLGTALQLHPSSPCLWRYVRPSIVNRRRDWHLVHSQKETIGCRAEQVDRQ
ncbi:hypothetical protein PC120_g3477 [Phytophthora cactorum]|nr:hypothetical protein PC120_g3477 [Phytophthora cactorum]